MKPYWRSEEFGLEIYLGDCLEIMPQLERGFDLCLTDPPYGTNEEDAAKVWKVAGAFVEFDIDWDTELPSEAIELALRLVAPGGAAVVWTDGKQVGTMWTIFQKAGLNPLQLVYWRKANPPPKPRKNFCSAVEAAVFGRQSDGPVLWWGGGGVTHNVFETPLVGNKADRHPTEKPLPLFGWLVETLCKPGGSVIDPFLGSGTTLVACYRLGRKGVGIEISEEYCELATKRLGKEIAQLRIPEALETTPAPVQLAMGEGNQSND